MIIGITGTTGAGKDTVAEILEAQGFSHYSCSDAIREELKLRNLAETREGMIDMGNELREKYGYGILAERCLGMIHKDGVIYTLVSSIRHPDEVAALKENNFVLLSIDADPKVRYARNMARGRKGDVRTFEEFLHFENQEMNGTESGQQLKKCMDLADHKLMNNGSVDELRSKVLKVLEEILK